ncbi:hypothetical protein [Methylobacter sp.]|uniref:hypothetical protein n=1 Tax=Methylobacter sp. TaxID=2051955 RepID=UPI002FDE5F23
MPLQDLVEYFNDRFELEHRSTYRPFILENGEVSGLFGPIRIDSIFSPLRQTLKPTTIVGHTAQITVATHKTPPLYSNEIENIRTDSSVQATNFESIINFDRLSRTVHMLNYLALPRLQGLLFLEVDPRHILGIKQDHGAYFEEAIARCGLENKNIVISMAVFSQYDRYYQELINGLDNYRRRGYRIALKFDYIPQKNQSDLITKLSPDYVAFSAINIDSKIEETLYQLKVLVASVGGLSILQQIDDKKTDTLARNIGFDLVEGSYYRAIAFDYFDSAKPKKLNIPLSENR